MGGDEGPLRREPKHGKALPAGWSGWLAWWPSLAPLVVFNHVLFAGQCSAAALFSWSAHPLPTSAQEHPAVRKLMLPMMMADYKLMETWEPWGHDAQPSNGSSGAAGAVPAAVPASPQQQAACCSCFGMGQAQGAPPGMLLPCPLAAFGAEYDNR